LLKCKVCASTEFAEVLNFKKTVFSDGYTIEKPHVNIVLLVNPAHMEKVKSLFNGFNNIEFVDIFKGVKGDLE
jgi:hypothetical protein